MSRQRSLSRAAIVRDRRLIPERYSAAGRHDRASRMSGLSGRVRRPEQGCPVKANDDSRSLFDDKLKLTLYSYWAPEYFGETGQNEILELRAMWTFDKVWYFTPKLDRWGTRPSGIIAAAAVRAGDVF